jgi:hypothetical protein
MTFRAILDDGKEHKPVLLLLTGQMTPKQIDKEYTKKCGLCPDCEGFFALNDQGDSSTYAAAMAGKDRTVAYRRGHYLSGTDDLLTQMHFAHKKGYLLSGLAPCSRCTLRQLIHQEAVEAIAHQYRKDMPKGFRVDAECQFVKPGTPPETYRPDIVVFNAFEGRHTCIEYQRSPEAFESFVHRHELRGSEWGNVIWFFDERIWERNSTCQARDWLFDNGQTFYKCWVDEDTMQLQVEEGTFATAVVKEVKGKRRLKKFVPKICSIADIVNEYLLATGQEQDGNRERTRQQEEPLKADRLQGFNLVEKSEADRVKTQALFESLKRQKAEREETERRRREYGARVGRLERIQSAAAYAAVLGEVATTQATFHWSIEDLDAECARLDGLQHEAAMAHAVIKRERELAEAEAAEAAMAVRLAEQQAQAVIDEEQRVIAAQRHQELMDARRREAEDRDAQRAREWLARQNEAKERESRERAAREQASALAKWGFPVGTTGVQVRWERGTSFLGFISSWYTGRPVIKNLANGNTRIAYDGSDYTQF